jgi:hypothetical protein
MKRRGNLLLFFLLSELQRVLSASLHEIQPAQRVTSIWPPGHPARRKAVPRKNPTVSLEEAKARFENWKQNREGKAAIPDELWAAAVEVAGKEGINRT